MFGKQHDYASLLAKVGLDPKSYREGEGPLTPPKSHAQAHTPGVTLADYARHAMLPADFLTSAGVGLREMQYLDQRAVRVPYRNPEGEEVAGELPRCRSIRRASGSDGGRARRRCSTASGAWTKHARPAS